MKKAEIIPDYLLERYVLQELPRSENRRIKNAIQHSTELQRRLKEIEGLKPKQIADKMDITYITVKKVCYKKTHLYIHEK